MVENGDSLFSKMIYSKLKYIHLIDDIEEDLDELEGEAEPDPEREYSSLKDILNDGQDDDYYGYDEENY